MIARSNTKGPKAAPSSVPVSSFTSTGRLLQRKCACGGHTAAGGECEKCGKKKLQRKATQPSTLDSQPSEVPRIVHEVLRSPGQPLDTETRAFMEPHFGYDFSNVRVHTDARASESARAVNALAYTVGSHVAVRSDKHEPRTAAGRRLLAHELAHVVQQSAGVGGGDPELRANVAAQRIMGGQQVNPASVGIAPVGLYRQHAEPDQDWFLKLLSLKSQLHAISLQTAIKLSQEKKGAIPASSPLLGQSSPSFSMRSPQSEHPINHPLSGGQGKKSGFRVEKGPFELSVEKQEESKFGSPIGPQNEEKLSFVQQRLKDALESLSVALKWTIPWRKEKK